jgi:hypothetical protein
MNKFAVTIGGMTGETVHIIETAGKSLTYKQLSKALVKLTKHWGICIESATFHTKHGNEFPVDNKVPTGAHIATSVVWYGDDVCCDDDCWVQLDLIENTCQID